MELKRNISKTSLLMLSFTAIFGSGWLFAPYYAAQIAGPASLISWLLGALMSIVIGITMAEVITLYPKPGGLFHAVHVCYGKFLALMMGFLNLLVFLVLPALEVRAVMQYASSHYSLLLTADNGDLSILCP